MSKKTKFLAIVGALCLWSAVLPTPANAQFHALFVGAIPDWVSAAFRALTAAVKYFLGDDTSLIAELVWDENSSTGCQGCGGCYGKNGISADALDLSVSWEGISLDESAYGTKGYVAQNQVADLAQKMIRDIMDEQASLSELDAERHKIYYKAQQRSIQAMVDALMMKKAYAELKGVVGKLSTSFDNYSVAASAVAQRRIVLDELMALKKRVVAARLRTKAQTMEIDSINTDALTIEPNIQDRPAN